MKRILALLLALSLALSLCACGNKDSGSTAANPPAEVESGLTPTQQLIANAVHSKIQSEEFAGWQSLFQEFTGEDPAAPEVTAVVHFQIDDFDGVEMDCYLVNVSAEIAWWMNEEAQEGATGTQFQLFVSQDGKTVVDSITTNAGNVEHDTATEEGRMTYLLWMFGNMQDGSYSGNFLNDMEKTQDLSAEDLAAINENL